MTDSVLRGDDATCARLHPDWRPGVDYSQAQQEHRAWETTAPTHAVPLLHDPPRWALGVGVILPVGTRLRYLGSSYRHGFPPWDFSAHVFQAETETGLGKCYEVGIQDAADDEEFWASLRPIV